MSFEPQAPQHPDDMSFLEHLESLRWHLIRAVASIFVFSVIVFMIPQFFVHELILGPSRLEFWTYQLFCDFSETTCIDKLPFTIQSRKLQGQFTMHLMSSMVIGLICAFPYAFWEIWRFIRPALYEAEQKATRGATLVVSLLFGTGILFGYYLVAPLSINFLSNYQLDPSIINEIDITSYVSTISMIVLACGIMFQLPIIVYFLSKAGLINPPLMRAFRRHAFVVILVLSAIITPPDVVSQILIAMPLVILYEGSIYISEWVWNKRESEEYLINS